MTIEELRIAKLVQALRVSGDCIKAMARELQKRGCDESAAAARELLKELEAVRTDRARKSLH